MAAISVIVPVYKVEKYLERCVRSIQNQTVRDIEIILVDDGSPDGCPAMCDALAETDSRIRVVHKQNGGLSSARNAGLDIATGKYIGFIDSDDYILPTMYEKLLSSLEATGAQVSICNYAYVSEDTDEIDKERLASSPLHDCVMTQAEAYAAVDYRSPDSAYYITAWNKLYRREIFDSCRFYDGRIHEDEFIIHRVFAQCSRISVVGEALYMYVQRKGSITKAAPKINTLDGVYALFDRYEFYRELGLHDSADTLLKNCFWRMSDTLQFAKPLKAGHYGELKAAYRLVSRELLRRRDLRALKLMAAWLKF